MTVDIKIDLSGVKIMPEDEIAEIVQNVQMIMATTKYTVPLDRAFGVDARFLDEPVNIAQARATAEITSAVNSQEPRARVQRIFFDGDLTGRFAITVRIEIVEERLRGYI